MISGVGDDDVGMVRHCGVGKGDIDAPSAVKGWHFPFIPLLVCAGTLSRFLLSATALCACVVVGHLATFKNALILITGQE